MPLRKNDRKAASILDTSPLRINALPTCGLPSEALAWPEERIRIVLGHELAHARRRDWLVQIAADLLRAVYWFNPLVWIVCRRATGQAYQPMIFATQEEATRDAEAIAAVVWPAADARQEYYFNTQNFS